MYYHILYAEVVRDMHNKNPVWVQGHTGFYSNNMIDVISEVFCTYTLRCLWYTHRFFLHYVLTNALKYFLHYLKDYMKGLLI